MECTIGSTAVSSEAVEMEEFDNDLGGAYERRDFGSETGIGSERKRGRAAATSEPPFSLYSCQG